MQEFTFDLYSLNCNVNNSKQNIIGYILLSVSSQVGLINKQVYMSSSIHGQIFTAWKLEDNTSQLALNFIL